MDDPRLSSVDGFISSQHHSDVPDKLKPEHAKLPPSLTVCIIGAGQGIGEHIALAYARACVSNLILAARTVSDLEKNAEMMKSISPETDVLTQSCDIASATSVRDLAEAVKAKFGRLDVLICNAGYAGPVTLKMEEGEPEWVQKAFDVNVMGTYHAAHYFLPLLLHSHRGAKTFFAIGSLAGCIRRGPIANSGYCISKMAQIRIIELLHEQHATDDILAVTIHPGAVETTMAKGNTPEAFLPYLTDNVALCGATCVWLSMHRSEVSWLSGRLISANWDMDELMTKSRLVVKDDLLKFTMAI